MLFLSGRLDPVTPPEWADQVARRFANARHLVIADGGHIIDGLTAIDTCLDPLVLRFFDTGDAKGVDASCLAQMTAPAFVTGDQASPPK